MNFLQNQNDPALPELKERLRNQFQFFGDDMLMTGSIGEWAAPLGARRRLARGAAPGRAGRLAQREQRAEPGGAAAGGRGLRGGEQGVRHHAAALDGAPRARGHRRSADAAQGARLRRADGARSAGSRRAIRRSSSGPPFRTIVDHGIQVGIHGDGVHIAPLNPWPHIYFAIDRRELVRRAGQRRPAAHARRRRCACSRAATAGSCGWRTRSARSSRASSPISSCSTATTSRCPTCRSDRSGRC